jgi:hypothetical protein
MELDVKLTQASLVPLEPLAKWYKIGQVLIVESENEKKGKRLISRGRPLSFVQVEKPN